MPATPAWPPHEPAAPVRRRAAGRGRSSSIEGARQLSRHGACGSGRATQVKLFDDRTGEWLAEIARGGQETRDAPHRRSACASGRRCPTSGCRSRRSSAAGSTGWSRRRPSWASPGWCRSITRRTIVDRLNLERLRAHAIEAAEQCERTGPAGARRAAQARRAARRTGPRTARSISPTRRAASRVGRRRARPGRDPDRPRRRLHRRGARRDPRPAPGRARSRSARASCAPTPPRWPRSRLDGGGRRLVAARRR